MTYEAFIGRFEKKTASGTGVMVKCPAHDDGSASLSVARASDGGILVKCHAGCSTENVVARMGLALRDLFAEPKSNGNGHATLPTAPPVKPVIEAVYSYTNATGEELYQAVRLKPKSFRQRHSVGAKWVWSMEGVERVLYRMTDLVRNGSDVVNVVEGEKDSDTLARAGFLATCNVGGAGKWLDGYTETLRGRDVAIWPDNDDPGRKHARIVLDSVCHAAKTTRLMEVPLPHKDVTDWKESFPNELEFAAAFQKAIDLATVLHGGIEVPVFSMAEAEAKYRAQVTQSETTMLHISDWLPSLKYDVRGILPGEVVFFLAATGVGKTALLSNLALAVAPLPTLFFQLELPLELTFERLAATVTQTPCADVFQKYKSGGSVGWREHGFANHISICPKSSVTATDIEGIIGKTELKTGVRPVLVLLDYIQLVGGQSRSRYERVSEVAEQVKVIAKRTNTIIVVASQVSRPSDDDPEVGLYDGKESGSIENTGGLVIGAWRDPDNAAIMKLRVLKNTKGRPGKIVTCNFHGDTMLITEKSTIEDADIPRHRQQHND